MKIQSFRELNVWKNAINLVKNIYLTTKSFPVYEQYGITSQMQRAAVSIPSNIAEGQASYHIKEYLRHLGIAQSSAAELETQVEICFCLGYFPKTTYTSLLEHTWFVRKQLRCLHKSLQSCHSLSPKTYHPSPSLLHHHSKSNKGGLM